MFVYNTTHFYIKESFDIVWNNLSSCLKDASDGSKEFNYNINWVGTANFPLYYIGLNLNRFNLNETIESLMCFNVENSV